MKQFIKLHSKDDNSLVIVPICEIKFISILENGGSCIEFKEGSCEVNESPERIFNMLEKE